MNKISLKQISELEAPSQSIFIKPFYYIAPRTFSRWLLDPSATDLSIVYRILSYYGWKFTVEFISIDTNEIEFSTDNYDRVFVRSKVLPFVFELVVEEKGRSNTHAGLRAGQIDCLIKARRLQRILYTCGLAPRVAIQKVHNPKNIPHLDESKLLDIF